MEYRIIIFPSVHYTLAGEKAMKETAIDHQVIPVPPYINEGCGLGIKLEASLLEQVLTILVEHGVEIEKII